MPANKKARTKRRAQQFRFTVTITQPDAVRALRAASAWHGLNCGRFVKEHLEAHFATTAAEIAPFV